jgi:heat shock protein HslJ
MNNLKMLGLCSVLTLPMMVTMVGAQPHESAEKPNLTTRRDANPLAGTQWELIEPVYAGLKKKPVLSFTGDRFSASVGCNGMSSTYTVKENAITIGMIMSTMKACEETLMNAEQQFAAALQKLRGYELSHGGTRLTITGAQKLVFSRTGPASWLDQPLKNWNRSDLDFPQLPRPVRQADAAVLKRLGDFVRRPEIDAEHAVTRAGWTLIGPRYTFGTVEVFMGAADADGMGRPMHYQAFVYAEGRYAGTLSPVAMDSRSDGALQVIRLVSPTRIIVDFDRYKATDPLSTPSSTSLVTFELKHDDIPTLTALSVS